MIIKVLFGVLVLSAAALIGVAVAVAVRVWWHLKGRRKQAGKAENLQERGLDSQRAYNTDHSDR